MRSTIGKSNPQMVSQTEMELRYKLREHKCLTETCKKIIPESSIWCPECREQDNEKEIIDLQKGVA